MDIRHAEKGDLPNIVELCKLHAAYEHTEYDGKNKEKLLSKAVFGEFPYLKCLVVVKEGSIMGYTTYMKQFSTWDADFYIYLDCLYLKEEIRGLGLGTAILKKIKEYAKTEKCTVIQWQTPYSNARAIQFYKKIGGVSKTKERFFISV